MAVLSKQKSTGWGFKLKIFPQNYYFRNRIKLVVVIITVMDKTKKNLDDLDLRITRQRRVILDEFKKIDLHLSADEVYERVRRKIPRVSLGTVYRNIWYAIPTAGQLLIKNT